MTTIETYLVDSFTNQVFKGNPAGVCLLIEALPVAKMQAIAKELGLSETAFLVPIEQDNRYSIRYFSPLMEIPLCGHATLAASKVLFEKNSAISTLYFETGQQLELVARRAGELIAMEFPVYDTFPQEAPQALLQALGIPVLINSAFNKENKILLLEIESSEQLVNLSPDFEQLQRSHDALNGVLVTAISTKSDFDFESRYFWPWSGSNEDPVTGATHTFLAKYWSTRLNKQKMNAYQCSERTGFMEVELLEGSKMMIKSAAQLVLKGELYV